MKTTRPDDDLHLLQLLRRGDPADGDLPPAPQDLARMRQAILTQVEGGEASSPRVNWRWAAAFVCVVVLAVAGWQLRTLSVRPAAVPEVAVTQANESVAVAEVAPVAAVPKVDETDEETTAKPAVAVAEAGSGDSGPARDGAASDENLQARTLRFTTRKGTQIIWILDPELEL